MVAFILMEEAQGILSAVPWGEAEKEAKDFFKEEWVEEVGITMLSEDLEEAVVLMEREGELGALEATLGVVVEIMKAIPVEGGGGSYNAGKKQQNECCYNSAGHGQVTITFV